MSNSLSVPALNVSQAVIWYLKISIKDMDDEASPNSFTSEGGKWMIKSNVWGALLTVILTVAAMLIKSFDNQEGTE